MFYCNSCQAFNEDFDKSTANATWINARTGFGRMFQHVECPECGNVLSAYVYLSEDESKDTEVVLYFYHLLEKYQKGVEEGGLLVDKKYAVQIIENWLENKRAARQTNITTHVHDYALINKDVYGFNHYKCAECGIEKRVNASHDKHKGDHKEGVQWG